MKRELNKVIDLNQQMQKLEDLEKERFEKVQKMREQDFLNESKMAQELDSAFYFCVVFNSRTERDKWLGEHNVVLTEDFFVKSEDFNPFVKQVQ